MNEFPDRTVHQGGPTMPDHDDVVRLDGSGAPYGAPRDAWAAVVGGITSPVATAHHERDRSQLCELLAGHLGVNADMVAVGNGIDELVQLIVQTFLGGSGDMMVSPAPSTGYLRALVVAGNRVRTVPLENYRVASRAICAALSDDIELTFVGNPPDLTGTVLDEAEIEQIMAAAEMSGTIVVFDEAHIDFAGQEIQHALAAVRAGRPAFILRTFSNAWGMTPAEIGYVVGPQELIRRISRARPSSSSHVNYQAAVAALADEAFIKRVRERTAKARDRLYRGLSAIGVDFVPSVTNFVLVRTGGDSSAVTARLAAEYDILVRDLAPFGLAGCVRVTVGDAGNIDLLCRALAAVLASQVMWAYDAATLFNGYVGGSLAFALEELGVWERLAEGPVAVSTLARQVGADPARLQALLNGAARMGHVEVRDSSAYLTRAGHELADNRGFFTWGVGGYGELLRALPDLATGQVRWKRDISRDERRVASGAAQVGRALMTTVETEVLADLTFTSVADVGCGDGSRLLRLCGGQPRRRGLGLDISTAACELAAKRIAAAGLASCVTISCQNIFKPGNQHVFPEFELVSSFLMLHDLFAIYNDDGARVVSALRTAFPDARYFLLADTNAHPWQEHSGPPPIFSVEFELVHAFMGVKIHTRETYERAFRAGGLEIERCESLGVPSTWLYLLRVPDGYRP